MGSIQIVCDARIDHAEQLSEAVGIPYQVDGSNAALLARCWSQAGIGIFEHLEGDFAFALWDEAQQLLVLARDPIGQRPLHYREVSGGIVFASTALALARIEGPAEPDPERMASFLSFVIDPAPTTFFKGVNRVLPGHVLTFRSDRVIRQQRWWKPRTRPSRIGYAEGVERMHTEIDRAVRAHLATNAPVVAAQLSGGHDSSLVVASAAALIDPGKQVVAITGDGAGAKAELPADSFDEAEVAAETAAMLPNVTHLFARVDPESPLAATDRWFAGGQPMLNPFNLGWLDHSFDLAREAGAQVMLIGRAGNMTVSHWGSDLFPMLARSGRIQRLMREWRSYRRAFRPTPAGMLAMTFGPWIPGPLWNWLALRRGGEVEPFDERAFLRPQSSWARRALKIGRAQGLAVSAAPGRLFGGKLRWLELLWADPGPMNHWVRARHGIELRDPLASRRVMELSFQLGPDHFYRDGQGRRLSRTLLEGRVPERVTSEHRRGMQGVNWAASAELAREQMLVEVELIARDATLSALFDVERMRGMLESWPKDWSDADLSEQYRGFFSTAVCAARWARCVREPGRAAERR